MDRKIQTFYRRRPFAGRSLICHSDRGRRYVGTRYTGRFAQGGIEPCVGSVGGGYDNALAETVIDPFEAEGSFLDRSNGLMDLTIGSKARLAFAPMLYTGQRRSDAIMMGWQHMDGNRIKVRQQKTDVRLEIPMHSWLRKVMELTPHENLTFPVTAYDKPFTAAGFGNWFRDRCNEVSLPHCSAHGLRKAAARRLADPGCGNQQINAIAGHKTEKEVGRYAAAADQKRLAEQAMAAAYGTDGEQEMSNQPEKLDRNDANALNLRGLLMKVAERGAFRHSSQNR